MDYKWLMKNIWKDTKDGYKEYVKDYPSLCSRFLFWWYIVIALIKTMSLVVSNIIESIHIKLYGIWCVIKGCTPWERAKIYLAYEKYKETSMYRERLVHLGEKYATKQFVEGEFRYFKGKISKREKIGILFAPYSYISKYKPMFTFDINELSEEDE